ncbi:type IV secretory system conjugative DNA transfer family protein [Xanthovirga aplysinae]|uniref:type IV secretory system conjugative DNA transfer family protein n=1 Tax=Xanthovirga aplysinae TaxID=2529853 RepID=UPI0012BB6CB7|nr:type IV secretory system conjugative DNA transfer family protein [Xanthovirga aplysinae]MTI33295.1 hypothetical protein [Xanthovirga aplysinae]
MSSQSEGNYGSLLMIGLVSLLLVFFDILYLSEIQFSELQVAFEFYEERIMPQLGKWQGLIFRLGFTGCIIIYTVLDRKRKAHKLKKSNYKLKGSLFFLFMLLFCVVPIPFSQVGSFPIIYLFPWGIISIIGVANIAYGGLLIREALGLDEDEEENDLPLLEIEQEVLEDAVWHWKVKPINNKGKKQGYVNVARPQQGVLVVGGAGAGKSFTFFNPILRQSAFDEDAAFVYDFKFPTLAKIVRKAELDGKGGTKFFYVNFRDMRKTNRCNPLHPDNIATKQFLKEYSQAVMKNLNPEWIKKQDFWAQNAIAYFEGVAWWLKKNAPQYCTLPHVVALITYDFRKVLEVLVLDDEVRAMILPIYDAWKLNAEQQLAGVVSSVQLPVSKLDTPELFWVLSGDDFDFDINNPDSPKYVTVGNDPSIQDTVSPIISLMATVAMKQMNQQGKRRSIFCLDEAPTLFIPNLDNLPATARSNKVSTIVGVQDFSQMEKMYGREQAQVLISNLGNQFIGMVNDTQTAEKVGKMFGRANVQKTSTSESQSGDSVSFSRQKEEVVPASYIMGQKLGCFVGKVTEGNKNLFRAKFLVEKTPEVTDDMMPKFFNENVSDNEIEGILEMNYIQIKHEARSLIDALVVEEEEKETA